MVVGEEGTGVALGIRPESNIWAAWAVDREFVNILGLTGEVSNLFWLDFELLWLSGVCSGLSRSTLRCICGEG